MGTFLRSCNEFTLILLLFKVSFLQVKVAGIVTKAMEYNGGIQ